MYCSTQRIFVSDNDHRAQGTPTVLGNGDILTLPELFPDWELPIRELWPPIFTEEEFLP
jgi:Uma2 family endonuclease